MRRARTASVLALLAMVLPALPAMVLPAPPAAGAGDNVQYWAREFPLTDFTRRAVELADIRSDGAIRDSIPPILEPRFVGVQEITGLGELEPVISVTVNFVSRAYPLRVLLWHETVNDEIAGEPVLVSYCPLCNSAAVFERRVGGFARVFGNTGRLRHFSPLLYDRESETWWQQFTGRAVVGKLTGRRLKRLASRVESLARFRERHPDGEILVPGAPGARPYGSTPYVRMDSSAGEGLDAYGLPDGVAPYARVVAVGNEAWTMKRLAEKGPFERDGLYIARLPGQNSVHDTRWIPFGRDVGNAVVRRYDAETGEWADAVHDVTFAFAFRAFRPDGILHAE